jgi:hypothetical protein
MFLLAGVEMVRAKMAAGGKATCRREAKQLTVSDKVLRKEKHDEHASTYCEGSGDGSHRGPVRRTIRCGGARRTILGAENDEPRPILRADNDDPRPILRLDNDDPRPVLRARNDETHRARAEDCDKAHQTVRHHTHAKAIPSCCDGSVRTRFQSASFDPAGQHE